MAGRRCILSGKARTHKVLDHEKHEVFEYERGTKGEGLCHGGTGRRRGGKVSREDYNRIFVLFSIKKA
jgi:hypothetical protein